MARIFVSSTFKDLEECRKKVSLVLRQMGHEDIAMEYFVAEDKRPLDKCLEAVASSDLYIGIFAWRYGYRPTGYERSITELEYRKAVECGKSCLIFLLDESAAWPRNLMDKGNDASKIEELRDEFSTNYIVSFFESGENLAREVGAAVHNWEKENENPIKEYGSIKELDLKQYIEAVSKRYCNIDLDALTPYKKEDYLKIRLSSVFVEQNVRENPPPVELPKEIWNKMHEEWDPEEECFPDGLTAEDLKRAKESYYSKDSKAVLDVISDERNKYIVILGDPGSGKSILTKYVILSVLQINNDEKLSIIFNSYLPLRVELREFAGLFAERECKTFLDYFQQLEETEGYSLTKEEIDNYLKNDGKAIIIFDGLDEIFDPNEWERINRMIVGFTLDYPKVRVIVTSRIIGYKRKILDDAGFSHFTLQDFEKQQIETFLDRWYPFVVDEKEIKSRKARITKALKDSPSIRQLAGNPLLLTILAIIGKHQELPRERWKLYDHAASVLVENWEVNKYLKRSSVDMDFIGEDDKKELLMKIAYKMQSSPKGLAGNFIHRKNLQQEIEIYLQNRYQKNPSDAKSIAESIIDQLRKVNFILCLYGADFYGFVHRTFLEYFCAMDIVQKFDNRELDPETLKSNYFEKYWEDPTWHEVLRLVCGMKEKFAGEIIECLMQVYDPQWFGNRPPLNISLAVKCLSELRNPNAIGETAKKLLERVLKLFEMVRWTQDIKEFLAEEIVPASKTIGEKWPSKDIIIDHFKQSRIYMDYFKAPSFFVASNLNFNLNDAWAEFVSDAGSNSELFYEAFLNKVTDRDDSRLLAVLAIGKYIPKKKKTFLLLSDISTKDQNHNIRFATIQELASGWHNDSGTTKILKDRIMNDQDPSVRSVSIHELAYGRHNDPETLKIIKYRAMNDKEDFVRSVAIQELARGWHENHETLKIIKHCATTEKGDFSRSTAIKELASGWHNDPDTLKIIKRIITEKENISRSTAIKELACGWHNDPDTLNIIKCAITDNDKFFRMTILQELARGWHDDPETLDIIKNFVKNDEESCVREKAVHELAYGWHDDSEIFNIIKNLAMKNDDDVRKAAVYELARNWHDYPETFNIIKECIINDRSSGVRFVAIQELSFGWHNSPETFNIIKDRAINDEFYFVRMSAIEELACGWHDNPETFNIIKGCAVNDEINFVRYTAIKELALGWYDNPEVFNIIKDRIINDEDSFVRRIALEEAVFGFYKNSETNNIVKIRIHIDKSPDVRMSAIEELACGWHDNPETLKFIKDRAMNDEDNDVRQSAVQELKKWWSEEAEENIEDDVSSEIITHEDKSFH